ncbi:MAG TPA: hypothetical protein VK601_28790, partial [Kofleriaceae bacterium]|nr:hypothetical protein [Kofleriaceae bacterium]
EAGHAAKVIKRRADDRPATGRRIAQIARPATSAPGRRRSGCAPRDRRAGTSAAGPPGMATHANRIKQPSEAWTVPLHVVVWTAITVGFIMALVVLMMR